MMTNVTKKKPEIKITTPAGRVLLLVDVEEYDDCICAVYCEPEMWATQTWTEDDLVKVVSELEDQEIEVVTGWEYPKYTTRKVSYDDADFDYEMAVAMATDAANALIEKGGIRNAA